MSQGNYSQCARETRNGACKANVVQYRVGPKELFLCRRHYRKYGEDRAIAFKRVESDHLNGLHGDGDERKSFAEQYASGEFYLWCSSCKDALASEELGVEPDEVLQATKLRDFMARIDASKKNAEEHFMTRWQQYPAQAIRSYGDEVRKYDILDSYCRQVLSIVESGQLSHAIDPENVKKMNIVEAYNSLSEKLKEDMAYNFIDGEIERDAAAKFLRLDRFA